VQIVKHSAKIVHHVIILIANHSQAEGFKISISLLIILDLLGVGMAVSVYFNDERSFWAIEVYDIGPNAMLPTELEPVKVSCTQFQPQAPSRTCHVGAQPPPETEKAGLSLFGSRHEALPSWRLLPLLSSPYKGEEVFRRQTADTYPRFPAFLNRS
jgi:hypothetical protein